MFPVAKILRLSGLLLTLAAAPAIAGSWQFTQGDFAGGGTFSGTFAGTDVDGDGWLTTFAGEVAAFQADFSGGTLVGAAQFGLADLYGLAYRLDGGPLGDDQAAPGEGLLVDNGSFALLGGEGVAGLPGSYVVDTLSGGETSSLLPITVTAVPEPASALLWAGGLALLLQRRPKRQRCLPKKAKLRSQAI